MRILRIVHDYWPCLGGNERWSAQHDRWFSEIAGDEVQTVVLRPEGLFEMPGYAELLQDFRFNGDFEVPHLPKVAVYQEIFPRRRGLSLARAFRKALAPWLRRPHDVIVTQIGAFHSIFCWLAKPVVFEPADLICPYHFHQSCPRTSPWTCRRCFRQGGFRWWIRDQLRLALYRRFDLIVHNEIAGRDLERVGLKFKHFRLNVMIDPDEMKQALNTVLERKQAGQVEELAGRCGPLLFQFNRLTDFKRPSILLDVAESLEDAGVVFAGDGPERASLEKRVRESPALRGRVAFLGALSPSSLGLLARNASLFVMTATGSNCNTSLFETMGLGVAPVAAIDTRDFPEEFLSRELILKLPENPVEIAAHIRALLANDGRRRAMVKRAERFVKENHSFDQMWAYRDRLTQLARQYGRAL